MSTISAVVICTNEEKNIEECVKSILWADEIIIIDGGSTDNTRGLASKYTDKIYENKWRGYAEQRKFSLTKVNCEWVFALDADERCTEELSKEIREAVNESSYSGYKMPRKSFFLGKWVKHCGWYPDYKLRLFKLKEVSLSDKLVHEEYILKGEAGALKSDILHYTVTSITGFMEKVNHYSTLSAKEKANKKNVSLFYLLIRPPFSFFREYILRGGFLDGIHGLMVSYFNMITSMLTYMKIWQIRNEKDSTG